VEFIRHAPELCAGLSLIDSGAAEGSFIEQLWSGRRVLSSGAFGTKFIGSSVLSGVDRLRSLKRRCRPLAKER
jgi:hypothetical protein